MLWQRFVNLIESKGRDGAVRFKDVSTNQNARALKDAQKSETGERVHLFYSRKDLSGQRKWCPTARG